MKLTKSEFLKWVNGQTQWVENEMLEPKNKRVADSEIVDVIEWRKVASILNRLIDGEIEIVEED